MVAFRLPTVTFPLYVDTLGKALAMGNEIHMYCSRCPPPDDFRRLNIVRLARRYGMDQSCMHDDLVGIVWCPACRAADRPDRDVSFRFGGPGRHSRWRR